MFFISETNLRRLIRSEVSTTLATMQNTIALQMQDLAKSKINEITYKMMEDKLTLEQGKNQQLVQANRELVSNVVALKQILAGQAHVALDTALNGAIEQFKVQLK